MRAIGSEMSKPDRCEQVALRKSSQEIVMPPSAAAGRSDGRYPATVEVIKGCATSPGSPSRPARPSVHWP
jgi:hypothetical protein